MTVSLSFTITMGSGCVFAAGDNTESAFHVEMTVDSETTTATRETEKTPTTAQHSTTASSTAASSDKKTTTESKKKPTAKTTATTAVKKKDKKKESKKVKTIEQEKVVEIDKEKTADPKEETTETKIIPKVYKDHSIEMQGKKETINGFLYFNQADAAWNDNGYRIKQAGCGPTSMAVVISSLKDQWVTPIDTAVWAYRHGYYSSDGASHSLIPALAKAYGLKCQGAGRDENKIREALKAGSPVICLMGPGYFTKNGHFMVLVGIDEQDQVTVADVGSRKRSQYQYHLDDIIAQSKSASAGGPFWIITTDESTKARDLSLESITKREKLELKYEVMSKTTVSSMKKTVRTGTPIMMMTDQKVIKGEEFIYITVIDSRQLATVTDMEFRQEKQYSMMELLTHTKSDLKGLSFWKLSGNCDFLLPLSKKENTKQTDEKTVKPKSTSTQTE